MKCFYIETKTFRNIAKKKKKSVGGHQPFHGNFALFSPVPEGEK